MQGLGAPDQDRSGGFERGGWVVPHFDEETATFENEVFARADAFLLGRRTYEIFSDSWGTMTYPRGNPIAEALNTLAKYVASTTVTDPQWANTTVLSSDLVAAVGPGRELQVDGSRTLVRWLLDNEVVDEMKPTRLPGGRRPGHTAVHRHRPDIALDVVESRVSPAG